MADAVRFVYFLREVRLLARQLEVDRKVTMSLANHLFGEIYDTMLLYGKFFPKYHLLLL